MFLPMNHGPFSCWNVLIARSLALFFGVFTFLNLAGELGIHGFDASGWWIDLRFLPGVINHVVLFI
jgi:hypothetical protein